VWRSGNRLRELEGEALDAPLAAEVVARSERAISKLDALRGDGDAQLDALIDRAVKVLRANVEAGRQLPQR
jgi:hypothetical protein